MLDASRQSQTAPVYRKYKHLVQGGPDASPVRRKGVGIGAISAAQPLPIDVDYDPPPSVAASSQEPTYSLPPRRVILTLDGAAIRAIIHKASRSDLAILPIKNLLAAGTLDNGGIMLLIRRFGLPPQGRVLLPGLTVEKIVNAIMSAPAATRSPAELKWLEATAIRLACETAGNTFNGPSATSSRQPKSDLRAIILRIATYVGAPHSIAILHRLVDLGIVGEDYVNMALARLQGSHEANPHRLVRSALARYAYHLEMPDFAIEIGGADAMIAAASPEMVQAMAKLVVHPEARTEDVQQWMHDASRWDQISLLADVWDRVRDAHQSSQPWRPFDNGPMDGAAIQLFRHLVDKGSLGAARLLARDVLQGSRELNPGFQAMFIGLAAGQGYAESARKGFERYFLHNQDSTALHSPADGRVVPWMALRLISVFVSLAETEESLHVEDAYAFAVKVAEICFPENRIPPTDMHAALAARALFIIANAKQTDPEKARALSMRALDGMRAVLEATPRTVPDTRTINVLLHELAKRSLPRARAKLNRLRSADLGPDGVALASVALEGAGDVLSEPKYGGLRMLTEKGRRGVLHKALDTEAGEAGLLNEQAAEVMRDMDDPELRRLLQGRAARSAHTRLQGRD